MLNGLKRAAKRRLRPVVAGIAQQVWAENGDEVIDARVDARVAASLATHWTEQVSPLVDERVALAPMLTARNQPIDPSAPDLVVPLGRRVEGELPLPPRSMWQIDVPGEDEYLATGREHLGRMTEILTANGAAPAEWGAVLEFGVGSGRLLRHLADHAQDHEVWGVDVDESGVNWLVEHLSPPFRFAPCSTEPHLPFDDRSFGLVYAGSVFTHIAELFDTWALELRRVTRSGGWLFLTFQDQHWVEQIRALDDDHWIGRRLEEGRPLVDRLGVDAWMVSLGRANTGAMVIHDRDALVRRWSQYFEVVAVESEARSLQSGIVLRRRS